jgi:8-oxo-dGTP pyrophosphatase MutT (NUDIX family)
MISILKFDSMVTPAKPASTVIIVRDNNKTIQVCMLKRSAGSEFLAGAYVFPGGKVDTQDHDKLLYEKSTISDLEATQILNTSSDGLAYFLAAIRESFEEAGILFAKSNSLDLSSSSLIEDLKNDRTKLINGELKFVELVKKYDLILLTDYLYYFAHWITPIAVPKRYDTRFFVARVPANQIVVHDNKETTDSIWITPTDALEQASEGKIQLIFPTIKNLEALSQFSSSEELIEHCKTLTNIPTVMPEIQLTDQGLIPVIKTIS